MSLADAFLAEIEAVLAAAALPGRPVTPADVMRAAAARDAGGLFPDRRVFTPAVPAC